MRIVSGTDIIDLGRSFFGLRARRGRTACIPYHRVLRIDRGGACVWARRLPPAPPMPTIERETRDAPDTLEAHGAHEEPRRGKASERSEGPGHAA